MHAGIGLGSNLGDREANLRRARRSLRALPGVTRLRASAPLFETSPVDCDESAGDFLNTVVEMEVPDDTDPARLLGDLQGIETILGRPARHPKNVARTVDLDLLYAGDLVMNTPQLILPHPRLHRRRFVLAPLAAIRPDLILPGLPHPVRRLLQTLEDPAAVRLVSETW